MDLVRKDSGNTLYWSRSNGGGWDGMLSQSAGIHGNGTLRWMADINGDGRADYVTKTNDNNIHYNLSQGRFSFAPGVTQDIGMGISNTAATWVIDLNGDGYADYVTHAISAGTPCFVYTLGGATGFGPRKDICSGIHGLGAYRWWADVNGDGALDYNAKNNDGNHYWNLFDPKTGTFMAGKSQAGMHTQGSFLRTMADINGDGKADYVVKNTDGCIYWNLSNGIGFGPPQNQCGLIGGAGVAAFADINGDGKADYVQFRQGTTIGANTTYVWHLSTGNGFTSAYSSYLTFNYMPPTTTTPLGGLLFGDVEGDGKNDVIGVFGDGVYRPVKAVSGSRLMTSIANGYGMTTTIAYLGSNQNGLAHLNNPPPMSTVAQIAVNDGRGNVATTTYRFGNGYYDRAEREFRGFGYANIALPCIQNHAIVSGAVVKTTETNCPVVRNWYHQNAAMRNTLMSSQRLSGADYLEITDYKYAIRTNVLPYRADLTTVWKMRPERNGACGNAATCEYSATDYHYDVFGNVYGKIEHGDYFMLGDERFTSYSYFYTTSPTLLVDKIAAERIYKGTNNTTPMLGETLYCYDQSGVATPNCGLSPTRGYLTTVKRWLKEENRYVSTHTAYNSNGTVLWTKDGVGNQTAYAYDTADPSLVRTTTNAKLQVWNTTWNLACQAPATQTDYNNVVVESIQYDPFCRLKRKDMPQGNYLAMSYCQAGSGTNDCTIVNPALNGQHIRAEFPNPDGSGAPSFSKRYLDGLGREIAEQRSTSTQTGSTETTLQTYNARGKIASIHRQSVLSETYLNYDRLDRSVAIIDAALGKTPTQSIDLAYTAPWRTTVISPDGETTHIVADAYGRTSKEQKVYSPTVAHETRYVYDTLGNRIEMYDAENNRWTDTYDSLGRKLSSYDPDRGLTRYAYFDTGKLRMKTDAKNVATCYEYDPLLRLQKRNAYCNGATPQAATWTYDEIRAGYANIGRLTSDHDVYTGVRSTYDYDNGGRMINETRMINAVTYAFRYGYDAGGRRKWTTFPDGDTLGTPLSPIQYDSAGRTTSIPGYVNQVMYRLGEKVDFVRFANGLTTAYGYDVAYRLGSISTYKANLTYLQNLTYARYADGKIKTIASPFADESWTYGYDTVGRLTSATNLSTAAHSQTFAYSPSGNLTYNSRIGNYVYPAPGIASVRPHAASSAGANAFEYDANGNLSKRNGIYLSWDRLNRLTSAHGGTSYLYDANDERVVKYYQIGTSVTMNVYVKPNYHVKNGVVTKHIQLNGHTIARKVGGVVNWIHNDHLGSVNVISDAAGNEVVRYRHRPFGERFGASNATQEEADFLGERLDIENGLIYQRSRYYDPVLGRYLSADRLNPQNLSVGPNRYAYAGNDPINHFDDGNRKIGAGAKGKDSDQSFGDAALDGARDAVKNKISDKLSEFVSDTAALMTDAYIAGAQVLYGRITGELTPEGYDRMKSDAELAEQRYLEKYSLAYLTQSINREIPDIWWYNMGGGLEDWRRYVDEHSPSEWRAEKARHETQDSAYRDLVNKGIQPGAADLGYGGVYFGPHGVPPTGGGSSSSNGSSGYSSSDTSGRWGPYTGWTNTSGMTYDSGANATPSTDDGDDGDD
jgi:RHS repeat-associated protein